MRHHHHDFTAPEAPENTRPPANPERCTYAPAQRLAQAALIERCRHTSRIAERASWIIIAIGAVLILPNIAAALAR